MFNRLTLKTYLTHLFLLVRLQIDSRGIFLFFPFPKFLIGEVLAPIWANIIIDFGQFDHDVPPRQVTHCLFYPSLVFQPHVALALGFYFLARIYWSFFLTWSSWTPCKVQPRTHQLKYISPMSLTLPDSKKKLLWCVPSINIMVRWKHGCLLHDIPQWACTSRRVKVVADSQVPQPTCSRYMSVGESD